MSTETEPRTVRDLEWIARADFSPSEDSFFDYLEVWRHPDTGALFLTTESGCRCCGAMHTDRPDPTTTEYLRRVVERSIDECENEDGRESGQDLLRALDDLTS